MLILILCKGVSAHGFLDLACALAYLAHAMFPDRIQEANYCIKAGYGCWGHTRLAQSLTVYLGLETITGHRLGIGESLLHLECVSRLIGHSVGRIKVLIVVNLDHDLPEPD